MGTTIERVMLAKERVAVKKALNVLRRHPPEFTWIPIGPVETCAFFVGKCQTPYCFVAWCDYRDGQSTGFFNETYQCLRYFHPKFV